MKVRKGIKKKKKLLFVESDLDGNLEPSLESAHNLGQDPIIRERKNWRDIYAEQKAVKKNVNDGTQRKLYLMREKDELGRGKESNVFGESIKKE